MNYSELKQTFQKFKRTSPREDLTAHIIEDGLPIEIHRVSPAFLYRVIEDRTPCGHFLAKEGRLWIAVDNSTSDAWTEEFHRKHQAIRWLRGKFEVCL